MADDRRRAAVRRAGSASARPLLARIARALALGAYVILLSLLDRRGWSGLSGSGLFDLRTGSRVRAVALTLALAVAWELLRAAPIGMLAAWCWRGRSALAAWATGLALAVVLTAVRLRRVGLGIGPLDPMLPALGATLGWWWALVWPRGGRARIRLAAGFATVALALAIGSATALLWASEPRPWAFDAASLTSDEKRRVYRLFKGGNPRKVPAGQTRALSLTSHDLDLLLAWGLPLVLGPEAKARVELAPSEDATLVGSFRLPAPGAAARYLNVELGARVRVEEGQLDVRDARVRVGRLELPAVAGRALARLARGLLNHEPRLRPVFDSLQQLRVDRDQVAVRYGRLELPPGLMADALWGSEATPGLREDVHECALRLLHLSPEAEGGGDRRFADALQAAFAWAAEASGPDEARSRNRAAILALGVLFGHTKLERLTGPVLSESEWEQAPPMSRVTLRGRADWTRHFFVSAALVVISAEAPAVEAGVFKEELDADGGSGFSFGDLLADRAGTTFAGVATSDADSARALQRRLARGFVVDDYFPPATGLPEDIPDAELQSRYGGVGGALYRRYADEIERRLVDCAAYR